MANEIDELKPISALDAIRDAKVHLEVALKPYALQVGKPLDAIDFENIQIAFHLLKMLLEANRG